MRSRLDRNICWDDIATECEYRIDAIARRCNVSRRHLHRFFVSHFGIPPKKWVDEIRASYAQAKLAEGEMVKSASSDSSFRQASSFNRFYHRVTGITPGNYAAQKKDVSNSYEKSQSGSRCPI